MEFAAVRNMDIFHHNQNIVPGRTSAGRVQILFITFRKTIRPE